MLLNSKIYLAGHNGLAGSAILKKLTERGYSNILIRTHAELDLTDGAAVKNFFETEKPDFVILAAAKVGGIYANKTFPAQFIHQNLEIQTNVISQSYRSGVKRLLFLGSSCIYPKDSPQPICEEYLLAGPLESTNRAYAIAKIAGIEMCWSFNKQYGTEYIAVMPTNLYGPGDNYDLDNSHVLPALIHKMHLAKVNGLKEVVVWGTGLPRREFLFSDDMADACIHLLCEIEVGDKNIFNSEKPPLINIGYGSDLTIGDLASIIKNIVGFGGEITFNKDMPDGTMRKLLDVTKLKSFNWSPTVDLESGISIAYQDFLQKFSNKVKNESKV